MKFWVIFLAFVLIGAPSALSISARIVRQKSSMRSRSWTSKNTRVHRDFQRKVSDDRSFLPIGGRYSCTIFYRPVKRFATLQRLVESMPGRVAVISVEKAGQKKFRHFLMLLWTHDVLFILYWIHDVDCLGYVLQWLVANFLLGTVHWFPWPVCCRWIQSKVSYLRSCILAQEFWLCHARRELLDTSLRCKQKEFC